MNMIRTLITLILIAGQNLSMAKSKPAVISGKIEGLDKKEIVLNYQEYTILEKQEKIEVEINDDGTFDINLSISGPTRAFIIAGSSMSEEKFIVKKDDGKDTLIVANTNKPNIFYFYLAPGDKQDIYVNVSDIEKSLKIKGKNSENSIYLNIEDRLFNQYRDKHLKNYFGYVHYSPETYLTYVSERTAKRRMFLKSYSRENKMSSHLIQVVDNTIYGDEILAKLLYPKMRSTYRKEAYSPSDSYYDFMYALKYDNSKISKGVAYYYFLDHTLKEKHRLSGSPEEFYDFVEKELPQRLLYEYYAFALGSDFKKKLYSKFVPKSRYGDLSRRVQEKYADREGMLEGNPMPTIEFEDKEGQKMSWDKWYGKLVYIDFWATWCGPCIDEIPAMESLKEEYKNNEIVFVSVSIDREKDYKKWISFLSEHKMQGEQLWVDAPNKDILTKSLHMVQIPRFILLDRKGQIIDANAPRPSDKRIKSIINEKLE